jgi:hypothetical protein
MVYYYKAHTSSKVFYHAMDSETLKNLTIDIPKPIISIAMTQIETNDFFNDRRILIATYPNEDAFYKDHPEYAI